MPPSPAFFKFYYFFFIISLLAIKRITLRRRAQLKLDFVPPEMGQQAFKLYFMCDSYLGCDQEYDLELNVKDPIEVPSSDEEEEEED